MDEGSYRNLTEDQVAALTAQGCTAGDWSLIRVAQDFDPVRVANTHFFGPVTIGRLDKKVYLAEGVERDTGIYNAAIGNCRIGDNVFINNIKSHIANYNIEDNVIINNVGTLAVDASSSFGNATEAAVINEAGGREIPICDNLSAHTAYIIALYRHKKTVIEKLKGMIAQYTDSVTSSTGLIGRGAKITDCGILKNIKIGPAAVLEGASRLENGTINSSHDVPAFVGADVIAKDFILSTGSKIADGAILERCFVGQGTEITKQFSAVDSVFFANCSCYHGEACSIFAGPYTVSHHKSTLLIAGMFSFFNAGSGSNQSNHMYKLGPVHQGIVERGSKTASESYLLWPARIGAFSIVLGKHYRNLDTSVLPFSYITERNGQSHLIPGINLQSIGTLRDSGKWPRRDKRKDPNKLDLITFDMLTPYTVGKMTAGLELLEELKHSTPHSRRYADYNGVKIKRSSLEKGISFYQMGIDQYLGRTVASRLCESDFGSIDDLRRLLGAETQVGKGRWLDLAGLVVPAEAIDSLLAEIENGTISSLDQVNTKLNQIHDNFATHEWAWVANTLQQNLGKALGQFTVEDIIVVIANGGAAAEKLGAMRTGDAGKEFGPASRIGFGIDCGEDERDADFEAVRGTAADNTFIAGLKERLETEKRTAGELIAKLEKLR